MKYTINELANSKGVSQPVREALLQMEDELEATNRQVEILSDALAESRREVSAKDQALDLALEALENVTVTGPDDDGIVWINLPGNGTTGKAILRVGKAGLIAAQCAQLYEEQRTKAITAIKQARSAPEESVRLQSVHCGTIYADGVPPVVPVQENTMIYKTFEQWKSGNVLEHGVPRTEYYSEDQLDLVEMGWNYGYDAGRAVEQALDKKAENARELGLDYEPVGEDWGPGPHEVHSLPPAAPVQEPLTWYEGAPPFPQDQEWFIAETIYGDRVVLRSLDEGREHKGNYAFKTADQTYMKQEIVKRWMQFPDCEYLPPAQEFVCSTGLCHYKEQPALKPLTNEQVGKAARDAHIAFCLNKHQTYEHALTRAVEAAHGITGEAK